MSVKRRLLRNKDIRSNPRLLCSVYRSEARTWRIFAVRSSSRLFDIRTTFWSLDSCLYMDMEKGYGLAQLFRLVDDTMHASSVPSEAF